MVNDAMSSMADGTTLMADTVAVGMSAMDGGPGMMGTFMHSGGMMTVRELDLGGRANDNGGYSISGTAVLLSSLENVGVSGSGNVTQYSGQNLVTLGINIGEILGSSGSYTLGGNGMLMANQIRIGVGGDGAFMQMGGMHMVAVETDLAVNPNSTGRYELDGGMFSTPALNIGLLGSGSLTQTGGTGVVGTVVLAENPWIFGIRESQRWPL